MSDTAPSDGVDGVRATGLVPPIVISVAAAMPVFLPGAVAVQLRNDLGVDSAGLGVAVAAFACGGVASSVLSGHISERLGPERSLRVAGVTSFVTMLAIAIGTRSYMSLVVLLVIAGMVQPLAQTGSNLFLVRRTDVRRLGLALGLKQAAVPAAALLCGLSVPALAIWAGWRWAFVAGSVVAVVGFVTVPSRHTVARRAVPQVVEDRRSSTAALVLLAVASASGSAAAAVVSTFYVDSATEAGVANGVAGLLVAGGSLCAMAARVRSGLRADQRSGGHLEIVAKMLAAGGVLYLLLGIGHTAVFIVLAPLVFSLAWGWAGLFHLAVIQSNPGGPARATGIVQMGTMAGAVLGPPLIGFVAGRFSYFAAWSTGALFCFFGAATMLIGRRVLTEPDPERATMPHLPHRPRRAAHDRGPS